MYTTNWKEETDKSFFECFMSINKTTTKILKLRVVKLIDGNYEAIVRDYETNRIVASRKADINKGYTLKYAQFLAIRLTRKLLEV